MSREPRVFVGRTTSVAARSCEQCGQGIDLPGVIVAPDVALCSPCGVRGFLSANGPDLWCAGLYRLLFKTNVGWVPAALPESVDAALTEARECLN
jgi:hypothetical protein